MEFHVRGNLWFVFFFYIWTFGLEKTWHFEEHLHMNAFKRQFHFQGFPFRASLSVYVSVCVSSDLLNSVMCDTYTFFRQRNDWNNSDSNNSAVDDDDDDEEKK